MCYIGVYIENFTRFASQNSKIKLIALIKSFSFIQMLVHTILYSRLFSVFFMSTIFLIFQSWSVFISNKFRFLVLDFFFSNFIDLKLRFFVFNVFRFWKTLDFAFWLVRSFCCQKLNNFKFKNNCNSDVSEAINWLGQNMKNTRWWFSCNDFRFNDLCNSRSALKKFAFCRVSSSFDFFLSKWFLNDIFFLSKTMFFFSWKFFFMNLTSSINEFDDIDSTFAYKKNLLFWRRV